MRSLLSDRDRAHRWIDKTAGATFEPFVERCGNAVRFANRFRAGATFQERCWPVFRPLRRRRWARLKTSWQNRKISAGITRSARLAAAKRWLCDNPLFVHVMAVEDARRKRKGGQL
jgi:hypothetical protein